MSELIIVSAHKNSGRTVILYPKDSCVKIDRLNPNTNPILGERLLMKHVVYSLLYLISIISNSYAGETRTIVLIAGKPSHPPGMHEFNAGVQLLSKCLENQSDLKVRLSLNGWPQEESLFDNAINYADKGFPVTELIAYYLERSSKNFQSYENFSDVWMPNGSSPKKGEIFKNPYLAKTYKLIAKTYGRSFYEGDTASSIIEILNKNGNPMVISDLEGFEPEWIDPVSTNYRGYDVWELPPNGQGIAALQILNILENFDIREMGFDSAEYIHVFTEAKKLAFEDRAQYYADPNFSKIPTQKLISKDYARERLELIDLNAAGRSYDAGLEHGDTIYLTVADKDGNMVSLIQSNYRGMGSGIVPKDSGFMLQDRGEMFSMDPNHMNSLVGGKRPFHTIIPAFITKNGNPFVSFGLMGGAMQPQGHAQIVINMIDFDMNLQEAGDAPRIRHMGSSEPTGEIMSDGGYLALESGFSAKTRKDLEKLGHIIKDEKGGFGGYQAIMLVNGVYFGASESRKDGQASGY